MLRKLSMLLIVLMLFLSCACAEEAAQNPFIGTWEVTNYINNGAAYTPEDLDYTEHLIIDADGITALQDEENWFMTYTLEGDTLLVEDTAFTLTSPNLMLGKNKEVTCIAVRIDPMVLNNPFIGKWAVLCRVYGETVEDFSDYGEEASLCFDAAAVTFIDGDNHETLACTYADGACRIVQEGIVITCTIDESGLLYLTPDYDSSVFIILAREDAVPPEHVMPYLGEWTILTVVESETVIADFQAYNQLQSIQEPDAYRFDWAYVTQTVDGQPVGSYHCTYTQDSCTIDYHSGTIECTIDEHGLMCIRSGSDFMIYLVRTPETESQPTE